MKISQEDYILKDLLRGTCITPMDALEDYGCFRLGARIYDLRNKGYDIKTKKIKRNKKTFAGYYIEKKTKKILTK